jgi:hypothetical protein
MITPATRQKAETVWNYIKKNQDVPVPTLAEKYGISVDDMTKLVLLYSMGSKDGFIEAYNLVT